MKRIEREHRLDRGLRGWIVNTARKNLWRVPYSYDLEDLIQDGMICYCVCNSRYKHVKEQKHFMALVKRTFTNHIHDLATERTRKGEVLVPPDSPALDHPEPGEAHCGALIRQLPLELQRMLHVLMHDAKNIPMIIHPDGTRETTNEYLCRLLGLDPEFVNVRQIFREHFES